MLEFFFNLIISSINNFSASSSSFPAFEIDSIISGFSDLHFSIIFVSKSAISLSSTSSKYPLTPQKIEILQNQIWKYSSNLETHTVETHVYRLRKKIKETFNDDNFIISKEDGYIIK